MTREKHDYRAMLEELQAHPNEERVVWRRPLTPASARQASTVAMSLRDWIRNPHRGPNNRIECNYAHCDPRHYGEGGAFSRSDKQASEALVIGKWLTSLTSNDPEPAIGTVVVDTWRTYWQRQPEGYWLQVNGRGDPESWAKVAGNYGPVEVVGGFLAEPSQLELGEVLARLKRENPTRVVRVGFAKPHSYRGDYSELAFELRHNITVGEMLAAAESAVDTTFEGWKGGDYQTTEHSFCWLVPAEGTSMGETLGALLLELLLAPGGGS